MAPEQLGPVWAMAPPTLSSLEPGYYSMAAKGLSLALQARGSDRSLVSTKEA